MDFLELKKRLFAINFLGKSTWEIVFMMESGETKITTQDVNVAKRIECGAMEKMFDDECGDLGLTYEQALRMAYGIAVEQEKIDILEKQKQDAERREAERLEAERKAIELKKALEPKETDITEAWLIEKGFERINDLSKTMRQYRIKFGDIIVRAITEPTKTKNVTLCFSFREVNEKGFRGRIDTDTKNQMEQVLAIQTKSYKQNDISIEWLMNEKGYTRGIAWSPYIGEYSCYKKRSITFRQRNGLWWCEFNAGGKECDLNVDSRNKLNDLIKIYGIEEQ